MTSSCSIPGKHGHSHSKPEKLHTRGSGKSHTGHRAGGDRGKCPAHLRWAWVVRKLKEEEWIISFQSRFGKQEWVKPYTDVILETWGNEGVHSVQVISPAFSADCLETLEELAMENRDNFINAGGKEYRYIPALNDDEMHIDLIEALTLPLVKGWTETLVGWV